MNPSGGFSAFISYASEDGEKAHDICKNLERRGATCWIAPRNVRAGREYADEIVTGIERSACMVVLLSQAANTSPFVCREVERAVANHKPILPVRIEAVMPDAGLELFLSGTHWLDVFEGDWDDHMRRLARDVTELTAGVSAPPARPGGGRRPFRLVYAAAALVLAAAGGFGTWTFLPGGSQTPPSETQRPPAERPASEPAIPPSPRVDAGTQSSAAAEGRSELSVPVEAGAGLPRPGTPERGAHRMGRDRRRQRIPAQYRVVVPPRGKASARTTAVPGPPAVRPSAELDVLRDAYDDLSIRGEVIDDSLNRLWEEMRPLAPRLDIATRQKSLKMSLTRARRGARQQGCCRGQEIPRHRAGGCRGARRVPGSLSRPGFRARELRWERWSS